MKYILLFFAFAVISISSAFAQTKSVSGTVLDEDGEPLVGATVKVTNTQEAVLTDIDGKFALQTSTNNKTVTVSFIGMITKVADITPDMVITLQYDETLLEEVVSVGYYQRKKGAMTGSVGVIKEETLKQPIVNITQMLQGSAPGVFAISSSGKPSSEASITIRGVTSINSGTDPLYIVDGIPIESGELSTINGSDIESMTILKDASSTALYGSRGSNGVILVQTKKGRHGETIVSYKGEYGFSSLLKGNLDMMNTAEKLAYEIKAGLIDPDTPSGQALIASRSKYDFDQFDEVFQTGTRQNHEISINGGDAKTQFYVSTSFLDQDGIIERSRFRKVTGTANLDHQAKSWLKIGTNMFLGQSIDNFPMTTEITSGTDTQNPVNLAIRLNPYEPLKDENGEYRKDLGTYGSNYNPLRDAKLTKYERKNINARNLTYLEIEPVKDLKFRTSIGINLRNQRTTQYASPEAGRAGNANGYAVKNNNLYYKIIQNNQINYKRKIDKHTATIMLGSEILKEKTETLGVSVYNVKHPYFTEISQYNNVYAGGWSGGYSIHTLASFYSILSYDFDNKYFLDLSFRTDGDSRLAVGNQWEQFWSVGALWNAKTENFLKDIDPISAAKLRFNIGSQGNSNVDDYIARGTYGFGTYLGNPASVPANLGDDNLTWERTLSYSVGTDMSFLNNRIRTTIDLYKRDTKNLFFAVPITLTSGLSSRLRNAGEMYNKGIEISLAGDILRNKDWYVGLEGNMTLNKNKVQKLYNDVKQITESSGMRIIKEGEAYGQAYGVRWAGVNPVNGDPLWYDKDGNITNVYSEDDSVILGGKNMLPNKTAGLAINAGYKGFSLHAMFTSIWDKWIVNNNLAYIELDNGQNATNYNHTKRSIDFWTKPGDVTKFPRYGSSKIVFDSRIIEDQSFIRLKNVTLAYTFNKKQLAPLKIIRSARLYATGQNLWTLTDYTGLDPEVSGSVDLGRYPASRSFTFGVELSF